MSQFADGIFLGISRTIVLSRDHGGQSTARISDFARRNLGQNTHQPHAMYGKIRVSMFLGILPTDCCDKKSLWKY